MHQGIVTGLPDWVPAEARRYLAHTEAGQGIRELARQEGCHASTVLRQIRRVETRRDDPLVDAALSSLAAAHFVRRRDDGTVPDDGPGEGVRNPFPEDGMETEAARILRRLSESGAVLAVAEGMEKAVVVRDDGAGDAARTAVVDAGVAQALALNEWIHCARPGRISRYRITAGGRAALGRMLARAENRASRGQEADLAGSIAKDGARRRPSGREGRRRGVRYGLPESPLTLLSRRRDRDGRPFLSGDLVAAGERLREDFELARTGTGRGAEAARERVSRALAELGPGLGDVVLRCCCHLEGLETAERRMGWSARSGKIVLRIALQRLRRHYDEQAQSDRLIG